jgi:hypothetical protein
VGVEHNGGIGRTFEELFEIPAAEVENFFGALWLRIFIGRMLFCGDGVRAIPGERRRLDGRIGKIGRDE